jgi:hypothetical protein
MATSEKKKLLGLGMHRRLLSFLSKAFPKGKQRDEFVEVTESDLINAGSMGMGEEAIVKGAAIQSLKRALTRRSFQAFALYVLGALYLISILGQPGMDWVLVLLLFLMGLKAILGSLYLDLKASSKSSILLLISSSASLVLVLILTMGETISCSDCSGPYLGSSSALLPFVFSSAVFVSMLAFSVLISFLWVMQSLISNGLWRQLALVLMAFGLELLMIFLMLGGSKYLAVLGVSWQISLGQNQGVGLSILIGWFSAALSSSVIMLSVLVRSSRARKSLLA